MSVSGTGRPHTHTVRLRPKVGRGETAYGLSAAAALDMALRELVRYAVA